MDILLAPVTKKAAESVGGGRLYRKQILKHATFKYKDRMIPFNRELSEQLAKAFNEKAYDTVPFVLADESNRHTMLPERARGEIVDMIPTEDGLDAILRLSEEAATIVKDNPKFGVSVRIVENLERGDGYRSPAAIQHVLGTWDPRMTGMSPWEAVEMSTDESDRVIDLTKEGEGDMPLNEEQEKRLKALLDLPEERFAALLTPAAEATEDVEDEGTELTAEELAELESILAEDSDVEAEAETPEVEATAEEPEKEMASLSNEDTTSVELSNLRNEQAALRAELAEARWEKERTDLANQGVPPAMLDLAAPVLLSQDSGIELSTGESVDAKKVVRDLLKQAAGYVDLSEEMGHQGHVETDEIDEMNKAADNAGWL